MHTLINPHRLRQSIKRLFTGRFDEVFGELFQNSQRAGAKTVRIHTGAEGWTYRDDGHGIPDIDGFRTLLSLGDSGFENPEVESFQHPMGLGFHALLALEGIESVTVSSVGGSVKIDVRRWWTDPEYFDDWVANCWSPTGGIDSGTLIEVKCGYITSADALYTLKAQSRFDPLVERGSPAEGYAGILDIFLDDVPLKTSTPEWADFKPFHETTYEGCEVRIGAEYGKVGACNWYGQVIELPSVISGIQVGITVRRGTPLNPLSPSRRGIRRDAAWWTFSNFCVEEILKFIIDPENRSKLIPDLLEKCLTGLPFGKERIPYLIARELANPRNKQIFRRDEDVLLLDAKVNLVHGTTVVPFDIGLKSFAGMVPGAFEVVRGDDGGMAKRLWWKMGDMLRPDLDAETRRFHGFGEFSLGTASVPGDWRPVTESVFVINRLTNTDIADASFAVGTDDPVRFLTVDPFFAFCYAEWDEGDTEETCRETYLDSVRELILRFLGNAIRRSFSHKDLTAFVKPDQGEIRTVEFLDFLDGEPTRLRLTTSTGFSRELAFFRL